MDKTALVRGLSAWASSARSPGDHCAQVRPRFRIPGAGTVDLLTVRHAAPHFAVGLWSIERGEIGDAAVDAMTRRIHAFEAWYADLLEHAELQGFSPAHRISVSGNLVARSVRRSPLVDLLASWDASLCFWTWRKSPAFDVRPYYAKGPALGSARSQLKGLLDHLPWEDTADRDLEAAPRK